MQLILIGGTTASGKSHIGRQLANELGIDHVCGDRLRIALQAESQPTDPVNVFRTRSAGEYLCEDPAVLCQQQAVVSAETCVRSFDPYLDEAVAQGRSLLLEGDDVLPAFAARWRGRLDVGVLFAIEDDPEMPLARTKEPGVAPDQIDTFAALHHCRRQQMRAEAIELGLPIVSPRSRDEWKFALGLG